MTNETNPMIALIDADARALNARDDNRPASDFACFRIAYDLTRIANAELAAALAIAPSNPDLDYYLSDDTYDDLSNPAYAINTCSIIFDLAADDAPDDFQYDALAETLIENIDHFCRDYNLDDAAADALLMPATLDELAAYIASIARR